MYKKKSKSILIEKEAHNRLIQSTITKTSKLELKSMVDPLIRNSA